MPKKSACAAKCARAHFASKWSRPSHRPPQGRPTLLLRACTIYALGGEWREPAAEDKLCVPVPRQAHTRTRAYVCNPMRSPGEETPRKAGCRRERTTKRLQMEANIIAHAWLTPENYGNLIASAPNPTKEITHFIFAAATRLLWALYQGHCVVNMHALLRT